MTAPEMRWRAGGARERAPALAALTASPFAANPWRACRGRATRVKKGARIAVTATAGGGDTDFARLETLLAADNQLEAVALAKSSSSLRAFGNARGVPKRSYTLEELRLNKIDTREFLAPEDSTLDDVRNKLQLAALAGAGAAYATHAIPTMTLVGNMIGLAFLLTADQVANAGGFEALAVDSIARVVSPTYAKRVALHEAGHFLVAYLTGFLPKSYTLSSLDAFMTTRRLNVQAGTTFCDAAFQEEISSGRLKSSSLDVYACVALAGVATEWLRFGRAEGGLADIMQLDNLMRGLGFTQKKADDEVRFAVLNTVTLLRTHRAVHDRLSKAMMERQSVSQCIRVIEGGIDDKDLLAGESSTESYIEKE